MDITSLTCDKQKHSISRRNYKCLQGEHLKNGFVAVVEKKKKVWSFFMHYLMYSVYILSVVALVYLQGLDNES